MNTQQETATLTFNRTLSASPEKVFKAWTDGALLAKWFLPNERWVGIEVKSDPVPGGKQYIKMTHQDGSVYTTYGEYKEVIPNEKVSFTWEFDDGESTTDCGFITITLKACATGTEMNLVHEKITGEEMKQSIEDGWNCCLQNLDSFVKGA